MNISELCIRRPVMTVCSRIAAIVAGIIAYTRLPVAAVPRVDFPVITVFANFPGASPETMATSVALPLEREFSTIAGAGEHVLDQRPGHARRSRSSSSSAATSTPRRRTCRRR